MNDHLDSHLSLFDEDGDLSDTAQRLRSALNAEADRVEPGHDGLRRIKERIAADDASGPRRRFVPLLAAAAAVVAAAGVTAGFISLQERPVQPGAHSVTPTTTSAPPVTTTTAAAPTTSTTSTSARTTTTTSDDSVVIEPDVPQGPLPVYWVGDNLRLYREYVAEPAGLSTRAERVEAAVGRMLEGGPRDGDYSSVWRPASVDATVTDSRITVDLGTRAFGRKIGLPLARAALQQLVYTATAAASSADPDEPLRTVELLVDGRSTNPWDVNLRQPLSRDADVLPDVWVLEPEEGARPPAGKITVSGLGRGFEGVLRWEVTDGDGRTVGSDVVSGGSMGTLKEFSFTVELPPGDYTVAVWSPSPKDAVDTKPFVDTKTFTVR